MSDQPADGRPSKSSAQDIVSVTEAARRHGRWIGPLREEIARGLVGHTQLVERLLVALLADGHVLLEGIPGLAKTSTLKAMAAAMGADFRSVPCTADMRPDDIIGAEIYNPPSVSFRVRHGPLSANFVLVDEINRAPERVQGALIQALETREVVIAGTAYALDDPLFVVATQNPQEFETTRPLREAQLDRFLMQLLVDYPSSAEERAMIDIVGMGAEIHAPARVLSIDDLLVSRIAVQAVFMDERIKDYIVSIVHATREPQHYGLKLERYLRHGASPRGTLGLVAAGKALAFLNGRGHVTPHDIKAVATDVLRHRIGTTDVADAETITSTEIIARILAAIPVP